LPNTLEKCIQALEENNADLVVFNAKAFCDDMPDEMLLRLDYTRNLPCQSYTNGHDLFMDSRGIGKYVVQSCCYMYRLKSHFTLHFIDGILHEDHYFTTMLFVNSSKIQVLKDRFFQRRIRPNSITTSALSMRHATGYFETAFVLHEHLSKKAINSKELSKYYNDLFQRGLRIERKIYQGYMKFYRKWELLNKSKAFINYKNFIRILFPVIYENIVSLLKISK
jgi:hypothetical protein